MSPILTMPSVPLELAGVEKELDPVTTSEFIKFFADTTKIPIPVPVLELFYYYLNILDEYYNAKQVFKTLLIDVKSAGWTGHKTVG